MVHQGSPQRPAEAASLLLSEKEAAKLLGFSHRTLQAWRGSGKGPPFVRVSARCIRYRQDHLEQWIEERIRTSTSECGSSGD